MDSQSRKITYGSLVLMIFSAIFGFSNSMTAFYQWDTQVLFGTSLPPWRFSCHQR